jgi:hypothetical protein
LPADLIAHGEPVEVQILLPTEETTLRPLAAFGEADGDDEGRPKARVAPALWTIPALGLPLDRVVPWLATLEAGRQPPMLRTLVAVSQVVMQLIERGDYAPAPQPGVLQWLPHWSRQAQWALAALADMVPGSLCTARFAVPDDPVYAVTQRNVLVSFTGHALDQVVQARRAAGQQPAPRFPKAERLPKD